MKKCNLLTIGAAIIALTGCTAGKSINNLFDKTGTVTTEQSKENVKKLYKEGVETVEDVETFEEEGETPAEETPVEEPKTEITSYHVDYSYEFAVKASVLDYPVINESEKETYSLTYVKDGDDLYLNMTLSHAYQMNNYYAGSETVNAILQDNVLYLTETLEFGGQAYEYKESYEIRKHNVYGEFGDFFRQTYLDLLFVEDDKEGSYDLLDILLTQENVAVTAADETSVSISFDYQDFYVTMVFDTTLETVTAATFDHTRALEEELSNIVIKDERPNEHDHGHGHAHEETPAEETPVEEESENLFKVDECKEVMKVNFSYNNQVANRLTEEEIAEYHTHHHYGDFNHHNDHHENGNGHGQEHGHGNHESQDWDDWNDWDEDDWDWDDWDWEDDDWGDDWDWDDDWSRRW